MGLGRLSSKIYATKPAKLPSRTSASEPLYQGASVDGAVAALNLHQLESAQRQASEVLEREPENARATHILGLVAQERGNSAEALEWITRSIKLAPHIPAFHNNLGEALRKSDRLEEALLSYQEALRLKEEYSDAHFNMGIAYRYLGQGEKALACNRRAVALSPHDPEIHLNLSITQFLTGDWENGFIEYEWRWKAQSFGTPRRNFRQPQWKGQDVKGKTVLVHAEQGFGDSIQFCRYVPLLAERGASVTVEVHPEVKELLKCLPARVIARGEAVGDFDFHCPMLSLPLGCGTRLDNVPAEVPYLRASSESIAKWAQRLHSAGWTGKKVGLVWAGRPTHKNDHNRSLFLEQFLPLGSVDGIRLISLQQGGAAGQAHRFLDSQTSGMAVEQYGPFDDFADTAGLVANLDLLISVDTAVVHLAGSLGKPVWMLNPLVCDWRWLLGRDDSPWYPTMRIFRQAETGKWEEAIQRVADALKEWVLSDQETDTLQGSPLVL
jgi:Flp pilus assembly protein TadD